MNGSTVVGVSTFSINAIALLIIKISWWSHEPSLAGDPTASPKPSKGSSICTSIRARTLWESMVSWCKRATSPQLQSRPKVSPRNWIQQEVSFSRLKCMLVAEAKVLLIPFRSFVKWTQGGCADRQDSTVDQRFHEKDDRLQPHHAPDH